MLDKQLTFTNTVWGMTGERKCHNLTAWKCWNYIFILFWKLVKVVRQGFDSPTDGTLANRYESFPGDYLQLRQILNELPSLKDVVMKLRSRLHRVCLKFWAAHCLGGSLEPISSLTSSLWDHGGMDSVPVRGAAARHGRLDSIKP